MHHRRLALFTLSILILTGLSACSSTQPQIEPQVEYKALPSTVTTYTTYKDVPKLVFLMPNGRYAQEHEVLDSIWDRRSDSDVHRFCVNLDNGNNECDLQAYSGALLSVSTKNQSIVITLDLMGNVLIGINGDHEPEVVDSVNTASKKSVSKERLCFSTPHLNSCQMITPGTIVVAGTDHHQRMFTVSPKGNLIVVNKF